MKNPEPTPATRSDHPVRFTVVLILGSLALSLPALMSGLLWDDYFFTGRLIQGDSPFTYYEFGRALTERNMAPWWISPDHQIRFFRPLASLTLHLDFKVMGASPLFAHLHSAAWYVVALVGGVRLLRTLLPINTAKWAAVFFATGAGHGMAIGWISARHAVLSAAFCIWSVLYYIYWRQQGRRRNAVIALALFVLGLFSSESSLAAVGVVLAYELAGARGALRSRLLAAVPTLGVALVYVILYKLAGYGAKGSSLYTDPFAQPTEFLLSVVPKVISIFGTFVFGVHTSATFRPGQSWLPLTAGGVGLVLLATGSLLCWRRFAPKERHLVKWLGLATVFGLGPSMASYPQGRSVILSSLVFAGAAAILFKGLFASHEHPSTRIPRLAVGVVLSLGLLVLSPVIRVGTSEFIRQGSQAEITLGTRSKFNCRPNARIVLLNGDQLFALHAPFVLAAHQRVSFSGWHQLSEPFADISVERTGKDSLRLTSRTRPLVNVMMLRVFRPRSDKLLANTIIESKHLRVQVQQTSSAGPTRAEFTIDGLTDPNRVCLLRYDGKDGVLRNANLPPPGKTMKIKWYKPPF